MPLPWLYVRKLIAQSWHCKPFEVDQAPADEVELELRFMEIESDVAAEESHG